MVGMFDGFLALPRGTGQDGHPKQGLSDLDPALIFLSRQIGTAIFACYSQHYVFGDCGQ